MRSPLLCLVSSVAVIAAVSGTRPLTAAEHSQAVVVVLDDQAQVPGETIGRAANETARIYRHTGVKLKWRGLSDPRGTAASTDLAMSPGDFTVRLIVQASLAGATGSPSRFLLGAAPPLALECGGVVYLYFDQVLGMARAQRVTPALVFGTAVAHEIGHVLLGRGHSAEGLMRASWKADDWHRAKLGLLLFSPHQGETIRTAISSCR
jgi:hypothetical protein